jgi:hypothetical protein
MGHFHKIGRVGGCLLNEVSKHEIDDDVNCVMMASENDQLLLGHAQIVKPLMNSEKIYFSKGSNLDNFNGMNHKNIYKIYNAFMAPSYSVVLCLTV